MRVRRTAVEHRQTMVVRAAIANRFLDWSGLCADREERGRLKVIYRIVRRAIRHSPGAISEGPRPAHAPRRRNVKVGNSRG